MKHITSGRLTLVFIAILSGMYLLLSLKYDEPLHAMLNLIGTSLLYGLLPVILFSLHLFLKGVYRFSSLRLKALPSALVFISLSLMILGICLSHILRETERYRMAVSDSTGKGQVLLDISMNMPDEITVVGEDYDLEIRDIEAIIDDSGKRLKLRPFPFTMTSSGYAYINDANISPSLEFITDTERSVLSKIEILPPNSDRILSLTKGYSLNIGLAEYKKATKEGIGPRHYRLDRPSYRVRVMRDGEVALEGVLGDNQLLKGKDILLKTGRTHKWVEVVFVKDKLVLFLYLSIALFLLGLLLYPLELYMTFKL